MNYEAVIGLEIHVQLSTRTKMFCGCEVTFGESPNTNVCPICLGHPGVLPVTNETAVEYATRIALALDCQIAKGTIFHRKNYFYPDLPKAYQISQYDLPLGVGGHLDVELDDGSTIRVGIPDATGASNHPTYRVSPRQMILLLILYAVARSEPVVQSRLRCFISSPSLEPLGDHGPVL